MTEETFNITRKFVRVIRVLPNGMVEFEFAIGEPDMAVELIMPKAAFDEFCASNEVEFVAGKDAEIDSEAAEADFNWNLHDATDRRFR